MGETTIIDVRTSDVRTALDTVAHRQYQGVIFAELGEDGRVTFGYAGAVVDPDAGNRVVEGTYQTRDGFDTADAAFGGLRAEAQTRYGYVLTTGAQSYAFDAPDLSQVQAEPPPPDASVRSIAPAASSDAERAGEGAGADATQGNHATSSVDSKDRDVSLGSAALAFGETVVVGGALIGLTGALAVTAPVLGPFLGGTALAVGIGSGFLDRMGEAFDADTRAGDDTSYQLRALFFGAVDAVTFGGSRVLEGLFDTSLVTGRHLESGEDRGARIGGGLGTAVLGVGGRSLWKTGQTVRAKVGSWLDARADAARGRAAIEALAKEIKQQLIRRANRESPGGDRTLAGYCGGSYGLVEQVAKVLPGDASAVGMSIRFADTGGGIHTIAFGRVGEQFFIFDPTIEQFSVNPAISNGPRAGNSISPAIVWDLTHPDGAQFVKDLHGESGLAWFDSADALSAALEAFAERLGADSATTWAIYEGD